MARRRLIWKVIPVYVAAVLLCIAVLAWVGGRSIITLLESERIASLDSHAAVLTHEAGEHIIRGETAQLRAMCDRLAARTGYRYTIINADGKVLGDSDPRGFSTPNQAHRSEFAQALAGQVQRNVLRSAVGERDLVYTAYPLRRSGQVVGALRIVAPDMNPAGLTWSIVARVGLLLLLVAAAAGLLFVWLYTRHIAQPLHDLQIGAVRFARGRLEQKLRVADTEEIGGLAESLNIMGRQLSEKIRTISEQSAEREAVLASMAEGVLAVDPQQVLISLNRKAAELLGVDPQAAPGKAVSQVVRNAPLLRFVSQAIASEAPVVGEITLPGPTGKLTLAASATALRNADQQRIGAVIVLNDITRLRELEGIRQEFVANVSHELKTPISAIKAAVETLLDSLEPPEQQSDNNDAAADEDEQLHRDERDLAAKRFLPMIARQTERLNAIVEDLLSLARLEQDKAHSPIPLEPMRVLPVLRGAAETVGAKVTARNQTLTIEAQPALGVIGNATLLGQAVVNLLDNAIKYSAHGTTIHLSAHRADTEVQIVVTDQGQGIEPQHIPRLFERFYRTDKARSRDQGGTGLGLAIVKHVAQTHGGRVSVESSPGKGSTFRLHLVAGEVPDDAR